jgi:hypothetical protein
LFFVRFYPQTCGGGDPCAAAGHDQHGQVAVGGGERPLLGLWTGAISPAPSLAKRSATVIVEMALFPRTSISTYPYDTDGRVIFPTTDKGRYWNSVTASCQ